MMPRTLPAEHGTRISHTGVRPMLNSRLYQMPPARWEPTGHQPANWMTFINPTMWMASILTPEELVFCGSHGWTHWKPITASLLENHEPQSHLSTLVRALGDVRLRGERLSPVATRWREALAGANQHPNYRAMSHNISLFSLFCLFLNISFGQNFYPNDLFATYQTNQVIYYAFDQSYYRTDYQWHLKNTGQNSLLYHNGILSATDLGGDSDINAIPAWAIRTESTIITALIDSGITTNHPDLYLNIYDGKNFTLRGEDLDPNNLQDIQGHGTHMAGIISATGNNGIGVCGVCWKSKLLICKTRLAYDGLGYEEIINALDYSISNNAKIIYLPWGGISQDIGLSNALVRVLNANILVITAAPNNSANLDSFPDYPISWKFPNIIAVTSLTRTDSLYTGGFSKTLVHLGAPGRVLPTTGSLINYPYVYDSGTSAAAAIVTGAASLIWSQYPNETWQQIKNRILSTTTPVSMLEVRAITGGKLNLGAAMKLNAPPLSPNSLRIIDN